MSSTEMEHWFRKEELVGVVGFEPTTRNPQSSGSGPLSYTPSDGKAITRYASWIGETTLPCSHSTRSRSASGRISWPIGYSR